LLLSLDLKKAFAFGEVYDGEKNMKANRVDASKYLKVEEGLKVPHF